MNKKLLRKILKDHHINTIGIEREHYQEADAICGIRNIPSDKMTITLEITRKTK